MNVTKTIGVLLLATALLSGLIVAWWGWHSLDASLLLLGARLC